MIRRKCGATSKAEHWWTSQNAVVLQTCSLPRLRGQTRGWQLISNRFSKLLDWVQPFGRREACGFPYTPREPIPMPLEPPTHQYMLLGGLGLKSRVFSACRFLDFASSLFVSSLLLLVVDFPFSFYYFSGGLSPVFSRVPSTQEPNKEAHESSLTCLPMLCPSEWKSRVYKELRDLYWGSPEEQNQENQ